MAPGIMLCTLDSRIYDTIPKTINTMTRIAAAKVNTAVLFFVHFPVEHVELWETVLVKTFCEAKGYDHVWHYQINHFDSSDLSKAAAGNAVILLGKTDARTKLSYVDFIPAPPKIGCVDFGQMVFYVELELSRSHQSSGGGAIGVVWAPEIYCVGKPYFANSNYSGCLRMLTAMVALQRYMSLHDGSTTDVGLASEALKTHLAGLIMMTDMRSDYFTDNYPLRQWKIAGLAHVVEGTILDGEFCDTYAYNSIGILPACYKINLNTKRYWFTNHSFDFWCYEDRGGTVSEVSGIGSKSEATGSADELSKMPAGFKLTTPTKEASLECMICLERPPTLLFEKCGHLGVCGPCATFMLNGQNMKNKSKGLSKGAANTSKLGLGKLWHLSLHCPYCRRTSRVVHVSKFRGQIVFPV